MITSKKIRLLPTQDQETKLWKYAGTSRWAYNWALDLQIKHFKKTGKLKAIDDGDLRKLLTSLKSKKKYAWLYDISCDVPKQAIKDLCKAIKTFHQKSKGNYKFKLSRIKSGKELDFTDLIYFPRFKSRKSDISFYNDVSNSKLKFNSNQIFLSTIGWISLAETNKIPSNIAYKNPRITFDGKYWYISVGFEVENKPVKLKKTSIGIDVGIKELAVVSNIKKPFKNINKTKTVKKIKKKLKRLQSKVSRKYEMNKDGLKFIKTKNIIKLEKQIKLLNRKLSNIRKNYIHQSTNEIVKTKPSRIVMETLNIKGMMKNKHLSKAIGEQGLYEFKRQIQYKSEKYGIEFVEADKWFPSSKLCSKCGNIKFDLKLKDRIYKCDCGLKIDRDKNASINLANYKLA